MDMTMFRRRGLLLNTPHIVNESDSIVTFDSAYNKVPIKSLICNIKPIQDLHGYDRPWPAGGGKNLIDSLKGINDTSNPTMIFLGAEERYVYPVHLNAGTYTMSIVFNTSVTASYFGYYADNSESGVPIGAFSSNSMSQTFTIETEGLYRFWLYRGGASGGAVLSSIKSVQVETGSEATSYVPYVNICPISGRTGLTVSYSRADTSDPTTISVNWQTEAGTVYGGTLDVISGKLVVDRANRGFNNASNWTTLTTANVFRHPALDPAIKTVDTSVAVNAITNEMTVTRYRYDVMKENYPSLSTDTQGRIYIAISDDVLTIEQLDMWLQSNPLQICYELAEPVEYQLSANEILALLGENNIWCDSGDVSVDYWKWGN